MVRVGAGSLIYRQIKSLHCSGYLMVLYILVDLPVLWPESYGQSHEYEV